MKDVMAFVSTYDMITQQRIKKYFSNEGGEVFFYGDFQ